MLLCEGERVCRGLKGGQRGLEYGIKQCKLILNQGVKTGYGRKRVTLFLTKKLTTFGMNP